MLMDFGKPHCDKIANAISESNIRLLDSLENGVTGATVEEKAHNLDLDNQAISAGNRVAAECLLQMSGVPHKDRAWLLDTSEYTTRLTVCKEAIQEGDLVVIQENFNSLDFVYCKSGEIYRNRNGSFPHDDIIGKPYGTKLRSQDFGGYAFCYLLKPTPELWTQSLNHRTQVVHELDQSQIIWQLALRPGSLVVESGTGSGALSHSILRAIAPIGHLHTYEFNRHRCDEARKEFELHGLSHLVSVHHKDTCRKDGHAPPGFFQDAGTVDAVVLDLPEPWLAVPHAAHVLKPNARIASYSPCVEQTQRAVVAMENAGFHSIRTIEYRLREYYVAEFEQQQPPSQPRPTKPAHDPSVYKEQPSPSSEQYQDKIEHSNVGSKRKAEEDKIEERTEEEVNRTMLVARPFTTIKGHTAFLTFATAGLIPQPCPNS